MNRIELVAPCHFGLEAVLKKEIQDLGYEIVQVEDGKVTFAGDENAIHDGVEGHKHHHNDRRKCKLQQTPGRKMLADGCTHNQKLLIKKKQLENLSDL